MYKTSGYEKVISDLLNQVNKFRLCRFASSLFSHHSQRQQQRRVYSQHNLHFLLLCFEIIFPFASAKMYPSRLWRLLPVVAAAALIFSLVSTALLDFARNEGSALSGGEEILEVRLVAAALDMTFECLVVAPSLTCFRFPRSLQRPGIKKPIIPRLHLASYCTRRTAKVYAN